MLAAGITAVWLNDVPLSLTVYPTPGARPMGDIDVLIPQAQVKPAMALLEAVTGVPPAYLSTDFDWAIVRRQVAVLGWIQAVARGLAISAKAFGTPLPTTILTDLAQQRPAHEAPLHTADHRVLGNRWTRMTDYLGTLGWAARIRTAVALVCPPPAYMRWRYHLRRGWQIPFYYPYRWFDVAREIARARQRGRQPPRGR